MPIDNNTLPNLSEPLTRELVRAFGRVRLRVLTDSNIEDLISHDARQSGRPLLRLAKDAKVSRATLYKWISGDMVPTIETLTKFLKEIYGEEMYLLAWSSYVVKMEADRLHPETVDEADKVD